MHHEDSHLSAGKSARGVSPAPPRSNLSSSSPANISQSTTEDNSSKGKPMKLNSPHKEPPGRPPPSPARKLSDASGGQASIAPRKTSDASPPLLPRKLSAAEGSVASTSSHSSEYSNFLTVEGGSPSLHPTSGATLREAPGRLSIIAPLIPSGSSSLSGKAPLRPAPLPVAAPPLLSHTHRLSLSGPSRPAPPKPRTPVASEATEETPWEAESVSKTVSEPESVSSPKPARLTPTSPPPPSRLMLPPRDTSVPGTASTLNAPLKPPTPSATQSAKLSFSSIEGAMAKPPPVPRGATTSTAAVESARQPVSAAASATVPPTNKQNPQPPTNKVNSATLDSPLLRSPKHRVPPVPHALAGTRPPASLTRSLPSGPSPNTMPPPRPAPSNSNSTAKVDSKDDEKNWVEFFDVTGQSLFVNIVTRGTFMHEDVERQKRANRAKRDSVVFLEAWQKEQEKEKVTKHRTNQLSMELQFGDSEDDDEMDGVMSAEKADNIIARTQMQLNKILKAPLYDRHKFPLERSRAILEDMTASPPPNDDNERSVKRRSVVTSICTSENLFVEHMQALSDQFFDILFLPSALKTFGTIGSESKVRALAIQIQELWEMHAKFVMELRTRADSWTPQQKVGDLILAWASQFRLHAQYAKDYPDVRVLMERASQTSAAFGHHFKDQKFALSSAESMLDCPVFHIARFNLNLKKLFRLTNKSHPDYNDLEKTVNVCIGTQEEVEEAGWMSSGANKEALAQLAQQFDAPLELSTIPRKLIKEGRLCVINPKAEPKFFHFHLLSDALLYSTFLEEKPGSSSPVVKLSLARAFDLSQLSIVLPLDPTRTTRSLISPMGDEFPMSSKTSFELAYNDRVIVVQTRNQHDKRGWIGAIRKAIEHAKIRTEKAPTVAIWTHNTATNKCMLCQNQFSLTRRRHHCRSCGKLVCDPCSSQRKVITHISANPVRVCKGCADGSSSNSLSNSSNNSSVGSNTSVLSTDDYSSDESIDGEGSVAGGAGGSNTPSRTPANRNLTARKPLQTPPRTVRELSIGSVTMSNKPKFALDVDATHVKLLKQDPHYALVHELIASEQEYVVDLELSYAFVVKPLLTAPELMSGGKRPPPSARGTSTSQKSSHDESNRSMNDEEIKELKDLLNLVQPLCSQNLVLLTKLIEKSSSTVWTPASHIGSLFTNNSSAFALYVSYAHAHAKAEQTLNKIGGLLANIDRQTVLREKSTKEKPYTSRILLKLPTLRIIQYIWYFQQLVGVGVQVYAPCLAEMQKHNSTVINTISKDEITKLEARFAGGKVSLVKEGRMLIKEGILSRITRRGVRSFYFHLLSDLLLYSDVLKNGTYNLHHSFELHFVSVVEPIGCPQPFALQINSPQKSFVIVCESKDDKAAWESSLHQCITGSKKVNGEHTSFAAPVWTQDQQSTCCVLCQSVFTAIKRRHHCRACGILVCNACSKTKQLLPNVDKKAVRVCDSCTHLNSGIR